jgi:hypothetical protein
MPLTLGTLAKASTSLLPLSLTYIASTFNGSNVSSYSFTGVNVGSTIAGGNTRYILVAIHGCVQSTAGNVSSVTIGGVSATRAARQSATAVDPTEIWYIQDNTLTSADVVVNFSSTQIHCAISTWQLVNPTSITPSSTGANVATATDVAVNITVAAGGVCMALASPNFNSGALSWTNATEQYEIQVDSSPTNCGGAYTNSAGTYNITGTQVETGNVLTVLAAAWG